MDKDSVNKVVAAVLANGMMSANHQSQDPETYMLVCKNFLHDLNESDKQDAKAKTDSYVDAMKNLG